MQEQIQKQLEATLIEAVNRVAKDNSIPVKKVRIKVSCITEEVDGGQQGTAKYEIMNGGTVVKTEKLKKILGIGLVDLLRKEELVESFMNVILGVLAGKLDIPIESANLRIYTRDGKAPLVTYFNGDQIAQHLTGAYIISTYMEFVEQMQNEGHIPKE